MNQYLRSSPAPVFGNVKRANLSPAERDARAFATLRAQLVESRPVNTHVRNHGGVDYQSDTNFQRDLREAMSGDPTQWYPLDATQTGALPGDSKLFGGHGYEQVDTFSAGHQAYNAQGMHQFLQPPLPSTPFPTPTPAPWYPPGYIAACPPLGIAHPCPRAATQHHWQAATLVAPPSTTAGRAMPTRSSGAAAYASSQASTALLTRSPASASPGSTKLLTPTNEALFNVAPAREEPSPEPFSIEPWQVSTENSLAAWNGRPVASVAAEPWYASLFPAFFMSPPEPVRPKKRAWEEVDEDQGASGSTTDSRPKRPRIDIDYEAGTSVVEYPDVGMPTQGDATVPHCQLINSRVHDVGEGVPDSDARENFTNFEQGSLWRPIASGSGAQGEKTYWLCPIGECTQTFARVEDWNRHFKGMAHRPVTNPPACYGCNKVFTRKDALKRHVESSLDPTCTSVPPRREPEEGGDEGEGVEGGV